jgi:hypothetical protein
MPLDVQENSLVDKIFYWFDRLDKTIFPADKTPMKDLRPTTLEYEEFIVDWNDASKRDNYEKLKLNLHEKYNVDPAKFLGFLEDYPNILEDVMIASKEINIDPNLLYNVGMQEGHANVADYGYESGRWMHSFGDIGLDTFFQEQNELLEKGYLKEKIVPMLWDDDSQQHIPDKQNMYNESGYQIETADLRSDDSWKAIGATLKQNEEYIKNIFKNRELDFNNLDEDQKSFWIYATYNGGAGNASGLLDSFGTNPLENQTLKSALGVDKHLIKQFLMHSHNPEGISFELVDWMSNVVRMVGAIDLTNLFNPFEIN